MTVYNYTSIFNTARPQQQQPPYIIINHPQVISTFAIDRLQQLSSQHLPLMVYNQSYFYLCLSWSTTTIISTFVFDGPLRQLQLHLSLMVHRFSTFGINHPQCHLHVHLQPSTTIVTTFAFDCPQLGENN